MRHKNNKKFCWETSDRVPMSFDMAAILTGNVSTWEKSLQCYRFCRTLTNNSRFTKAKFIYETILVIEQFYRKKSR